MGFLNLDFEKSPRKLPNHAINPRNDTDGRKGPPKLRQYIEQKPKLGVSETNGAPTQCEAGKKLELEYKKLFYKPQNVPNLFVAAGKMILPLLLSEAPYPMPAAET